MGAIASLITSLTIVYSTVYSDADQRKHQSSASLAFVWGIHRGPVNSSHKWPVTQKMFPFDDVIMGRWVSYFGWISTSFYIRSKWLLITELVNYIILNYIRRQIWVVCGIIVMKYIILSVYIKQSYTCQQRGIKFTHKWQIRYSAYEAPCSKMLIFSSIIVISPNDLFYQNIMCVHHSSCLNGMFHVNYWSLE